MRLTSLADLLLALAFIIVVLNNYFYWRVTTRLRTHHAEKWCELGQPRILKDEVVPATKGQKFHSFLFSRGYVQLGDVIVTFYANLLYAGVISAFLLSLYWTLIAVGLLENFCVFGCSSFTTFSSMPRS